VKLEKLLAAWGALILERCSDGRFVARGALPAWCRELKRRAVSWDSPFDAEEAFPFLSAFLPEAEAEWESPEGKRLDSDLWTETDRNGEEFHLEASAVVVDGVRVLVIMRNDRLFLIGQKLLQRARDLRLTHGSLMKEIENKDILVHSIVHDLASPLHSILGVLSLLTEQPLGPPSTEWVRLGIEAATRQREMIADILDVYSSESGVITPRAEGGVELASVIDEVVAEREPVARRRNLHILSGPVVSARVVAEETRLFRVLTNLLDNAFRHSPLGAAVKIGAYSEDASVVVSVEDEGPGVAKEVMPRLFEKFARGKERTPGTGLGLFYCRITVENWGGGIGYEPRDEGGARFWIRLRAAAPSSRRGAEIERKVGDVEAPAR